MARRENRGLLKAAATWTSTILAIPILLPATELVFKDNLPLRLGVVAFLISVSVMLLLRLHRTQSDQEPDEGKALSEAAEMLAAATKTQWHKEAADLGFAPESRRLIDIRWTVPKNRRARIPNIERTGTLNRLPRLLDRPEVHRLIILGEAATGKTSAAVYLTLRLLAGRTAASGSDPVPVLFHLADWDPRVHFDDWIVANLVEQHPWLKSRRYGIDLPRQLVHSGLVLPVLDAFDEITGRTASSAEENRSEALRSIRDSTIPKIVVSSRKPEFERAETEATWLAAAVVVELQTLSTDQIKQYLKAAAPAARIGAWGPVLASVTRDSVVTESLSRPLVLALVPEVYAEGDPSELTAFDTAEELRTHVLSRFAPTRFAVTPRRDDRRRGRTPREDAMRWLRFLAERTRSDGAWEPIAWWQFSAFAPAPTRWTAGVLALVSTVASFGFGMSIFLTAVGVDARPAWWIGCLIGLGAGLALGGACLRNPPPGPSETQFEVNRDHLLAAVRTGIPLFLFVAALGMVFLDPVTSLLFAFAFACPIAFLYAVIAPDSEPIATHPDLLLQRDLRVGYVFGIGYAIPAFIVGYAVSGNLQLSLVVASATAIAGGLFYGMQWVLAFRHRHAGAAAFVHLLLTVLFLAPRHLPWRVMRFLREAHRVGVLRLEPGGTYRFRHSGIAAAIADQAPESG